MKDESTLSGLTVANFSKQIDGKETMLCILTNNKGAELTITNYGAKIVSLMVPERSGKLTDVVTGHNSIDEYLVSEEPYFGAICGRYGNRIASGKFTLDGIVYDKLAINNGPNSLHGGLKGFNSVVWDLNKIDGQTVELKYTSADGEEGFPGKLDTTVTYQLSEDNEVIITYHAVTNKPTVVNLSHHSFFNLKGEGNGTVLDNVLTIRASRTTPVDSVLIPTGEIADVTGTPFDFRQPHAIGERIEADNAQLRIGLGYDHNWIIDRRTADEVELAATVYEPTTGRTLEVWSDQPALQYYSGNIFAGSSVGKTGKALRYRESLARETQKYPDSPNHADFPSTVLRPGETYTQTCIYRFGAK